MGFPFNSSLLDLEKLTKFGCFFVGSHQIIQLIFTAPIFPSLVYCQKSFFGVNYNYLLLFSDHQDHVHDQIKDLDGIEEVVIVVIVEAGNNYF
jgi:hypothetical protein